MKNVKKQLFKTLVTSFLNNDIKYSLLGNAESYPEIINSDIDIIVDKTDLSKCINILRNLENENLKLVQLIQHEPTGFYFVLNFQDDRDIGFLIPDICTDYLRNGKRFFTADYLMQGHSFAKDKNGVYKAFKVLSNEKEFIYYLTKKIDKNDLNFSNFEHLLTQWKLDGSNCKNELQLLFSKENVELISRCFENNDFQELKNNNKFLQKNLNRRKEFKGLDFFKKYKTKLLRIIRPTGLFIVIMGPDGSGKTTVIDIVNEKIAPAFRKTEQYHLFPTKTKNNKSPVTNPHGSKPRGFIGSILKLIYFVQLYTIGYIKRIYPALIRSTFVVFDRYYHDILVDPIRYRNGASSFWVKLFSVFIPTPDLWILLDVPADVLQKRKQEVSFEESKRQREGYLELFSKLKNAHIINANRILPDVCKDVQNTILNHMHLRTLNRIKNL